MVDIEVELMNKGSYVDVTGGKYKGWCGIIHQMKPKFIMVEMKQNKKKEAIHALKIVKVGRHYVKMGSMPPIEMPSMEDVVVVDQFANEQAVADKVVENSPLEAVLKDMKDITDPIIEDDSDHDNGMAEVNQAKMIKENYVEVNIPTFEQMEDIQRQLKESLELIQIYKNMRIDDLADELSKYKIQHMELMEENKAKENVIEGFKKLCNEIS
jgi:hypothetical protein